MNCRLAKETLVSRTYGSLDPESDRDVEAHLESCARCRSWYAQFDSTRNKLDAFQVPTGPRIPIIEPTTLSRPLSGRHRFRRRLWANRISHVAAIALILVGLFALLRGQIDVDRGGLSLHLSWDGESPVSSNHSAVAETVSLQSALRPIQNELRHSRWQSHEQRTELLGAIERRVELLGEATTIHVGHLQRQIDDLNHALELLARPVSRTAFGIPAPYRNR